MLLKEVIYMSSWSKNVIIAALKHVTFSANSPKDADPPNCNPYKGMTLQAYLSTHPPSSQPGINGSLSTTPGNYKTSERQT